MLRFTVPLYTHKKTQIIAYYADGTQTLAQVYVLYRSYCQTEVSWHRLCASPRAGAVVEGRDRNVCVVSETGYTVQYSTENHHLLQVQHIQKLIPLLHSDRQTLHSLLQFFFFF